SSSRRCGGSGRPAGERDMKTIDIFLRRLFDAFHVLSGVSPPRPQPQSNAGSHPDLDFAAEVCTVQYRLPENNRDIAQKARAVLWQNGVAAHGSTDGFQIPYATPPSSAPPRSSSLVRSLRPLPILSRSDNVFYLDNDERPRMSQIRDNPEVALIEIRRKA